MEELPPESRITSRAVGPALVITIPASGNAARGCMGGSRAAAAVFAFLGVSCTSQGILSANPLWTIAGLIFCLLTGWQLLALRGGLFLTPHSTRLEITPDSLATLTGPTDAMGRQEWLRTTVAEIRVEPKPGSRAPALCLHLQDGQPDVYILSGHNSGELDWIADQIRRKWTLVSDEPTS